MRTYTKRTKITDNDINSFFILTRISFSKTVLKVRLQNVKSTSGKAEID